MPLVNANTLSADVLNTLEPHRMNNWTLDITTGLNPDDKQSIILGLQSFQLPTETSDLIEIYYMNEKRQYAGRTHYDGGTLTLTDWINRGTADAIGKWRNLVYNPRTGNIGFKSNYALTGILTLYAPGAVAGTGTLPGLNTNTPIITKVWRLLRMWPMSVSYGALDMSASEKVQLDVQFVYDKAIPQIPSPGTAITIIPPRG